LLNYFGAGKSDVVCDPFLGSGTTAVECRLLGIPFVGIEVCPLSALLSWTKAAFPLDPQLLRQGAKQFVRDYWRGWNSFLGGRDVHSLDHSAILARPGNPVPAFSNVERWFTQEALLGVSIAVELALKESGFARDALLVALSARMRSIGNVDVDVVRAEYRATPRTDVNVGEIVAKHINRMANSIDASVHSHGDLVGPPNAVTVHEASVLDVDLGARSLTHVITSPPYGVEALSYLRTHLLSYRALVAELKHDPYETRDKTIGSEYVEPLAVGDRPGVRKVSPTFHEFFGAEEVAPKMEARRRAMMQFFQDMLSVGERMSEWLDDGGQVAFVVGNKRLGDRVIPTDEIICEVFASVGLRTTGAIRHKLKTNNSNSQVPWQDRIIQEEAILLFQREART